jgi:spore coat protein A, manganese oxidase
MMTFQLDLKSDKWLEPLRRMSTAVPVADPFGTATHYRISMNEVTHDFHPKLQGIPVWAYGNDCPGETIEAQVGKPVRVSWLNNLKTSSLRSVLALGPRQGMEEEHMLDKPHNQVHLHGARVPWSSDGFPEHVYHPNEGRVFYYPNEQPAATLWYHDHTMDVTRLNVYAGLSGMYLLRHEDEKTMLPSGDQEIALVLQDKSFSDDGKKLHYEQRVDFTDPANVEAVPEFVGDYPVVNGQIWPTLKLQPRIYRLRLCNGSNTRFFNLSLTQQINSQQSHEFHVIGTDGGFLPAPVCVQSLLLSPGERADVLLDLKHCRNHKLILRNNAPIPYSGDPADPRYAASDYLPLRADDPCSELLEIVVSRGTEEGYQDGRFDPAKIVLPPYVDPLPGSKPPDRSMFGAIEAVISPVPIDVQEIALVANQLNFMLRRFKLEEYQIEMSTPPGVVSPTVLMNGKSWNKPTPDPTPVVTQLGAVEVWEFVNVTPDTHPMHVHLVQFQVMSRTWLDVQPNPSRVSPTLPEPMDAVAYQNAAPVEDWEKGWKDTVQCHPGQSTRVLMKFDGYPGDYLFHCHILEHEDMGMMYRVKVEP